jgi:alpha-tubulin suppressor-like RCC1 family protein
MSKRQASEDTPDSKGRKIVKGKSPGLVHAKAIAEFKKLRAAYAAQYRNAINQSVQLWAASSSSRNRTLPPGTVSSAHFEVEFYRKQMTNLYERPVGKAVYSCGSNECGLLGFLIDEDKPATHDSSLFVPIPGLSNVISVVAGGIFSLALTDDGIIYSWGDNCEGQCGRPWWALKDGFMDSEAMSNITTPLPVPLDERIIAMSAGAAHSLALSINGSCYFMGAYRDEGKFYRDLGKDPRDPVYQKEKDELELKEKKRRKYEDEDVEANMTQFPVPPSGHQFLPIKISIPDKVMKIQCGSSFNAAVTRAGVCYTWGVGDYFGREVDGIFDLTPKPIAWSDEDYLAKSQFKRIVRDVACGFVHILVVAQDTPSPDWSVYSAGKSNYGQTGLGIVSTLMNETESVTKLTKVCVVLTLSFADIDTQTLLSL